MSVDVEIKKDLLYTETHEWVRVNGEIAEIGISDYAQKELGDLVYAEAEPVDSELSKGDILASIESVKMATDVYSPVSGTIVETNEEIESAPELLNQKPYETWIARVKMSDPSEADELMDAAAYKEHCNKEA